KTAPAIARSGRRADRIESSPGGAGSDYHAITPVNKCSGFGIAGRPGEKGGRGDQLTAGRDRRRAQARLFRTAALSKPDGRSRRKSLPWVEAMESGRRVFRRRARTRSWQRPRLFRLDAGAAGSW